MKKVMVFGTFDYVHAGHTYFLNQAKKEGDLLIVVIARDSNVVKFKGHAPIFTEEQRLAHVQGLDIANKVILGHKKDIFQVVKENNPDIICLGYDQIDHGLENKLQELKIDCKIIKIKGFKVDKLKSSKLKKQ